MTLEVLTLQPNHAEACDGIVSSLPYHFGQPQGRRDCAAAVRTQDGFVALREGQVVGFLTHARHFEVAAEITWMAVHAARRRSGIGRRLVERLCAKLGQEGRRYLLVLTVSPSDTTPEPLDGYQATRAFYLSMGFVCLRDLPGYWTSDLPVLLVRTL